MLIGFVAASRDSIAQLYVRIGYQRRGIGKLMLDWAKARSNGRLWLYTFARNKRACAFYERHGFKVTAEVTLSPDFTARPMWRDPQPPK